MQEIEQPLPPPSPYETLGALVDSRLSLDPAQRTHLTEVGKRLVASRRFEDAALVFRLLIASDPGQAFYHRAYGICCEQLDCLAEAGESLDRALQQDPEDVFARVGRAAVRMRTGDTRGALEDLQAADRVAPPAAQSLRARIRRLRAGAQRRLARRAHA